MTRTIAAKTSLKNSRPKELAVTQDVMTTGQAAAVLRIAPRTAAKWLTRGVLKGYILPCSQDRRIYKASVMAKARELGLFNDPTERPKVLIVGGQRWASNVAEALRKAGLTPVPVTSPGDLFAASLHVFQAAAIDLASYGRTDGVSLGRQIREHTNSIVIGLHADDEIDASALDDAFGLVARSSETTPAALAKLICDRLSV